jgi:HTH-type transcriptional regulator/antitoxin HipB
VNTSSEMTAKLSDPEYRSSFVESQINIGLPFKIKALRKQRNWTQPQLAERAGMKQSRISAIEKPGGGKLNIDTLCRLASAFDVALDVEFIPFGELMRRSDGFDPDSFTVKSFNDEITEDALAEQAKTQQQPKRAVAAKFPQWFVNAWTMRPTMPPRLSTEVARTAQFLIDQVAYDRWREFAKNVPTVAAYLDAAQGQMATAVQPPYVPIEQDTKAENVNWDLVEKEARDIPATWKPEHHRTQRGNRATGNRHASGGRVATRRQASR